jgi:hypothetical protein
VKIWGRWGSPRAPDNASWWTDANAAAEAPTAERIAALRYAAATPSNPDEAERTEEMLDGLDRLVALHEASTLPVMSTQHRVIGADVCHFSTPASLRQETDVPGRVFVTSTRLIFAATRVHAWPWHRVTRVLRAERAITAVVSGGDPPILIFNSYGDALMVAALAARLGARR